MSKGLGSAQETHGLMRIRYRSGSIHGSMYWHAFDPVRLGKDHRGGKSIRRKMMRIDKNGLVMILPSLVLPSVGILLGVYLIMLRFVDWSVPP
jgi:hypothetical protein